MICKKLTNILQNQVTFKMGYETTIGGCYGSKFQGTTRYTLMLPFTLRKWTVFTAAVLSVFV